MFDPRDDTRDRGEEGRDHTGDPRDVFLRDVDLPLEREREYVLDRGQVYELDGDDSRTLATVAAFRMSERGLSLLEVNRRERDSDEDGQEFHAGLSRAREVAHDASMFEAYRAEEVRIRHEHPDADIRRVVLETDLTREYQEFLQAHNRDRPDSDGRPDRDAREIEQWARDHELPHFDEQVHPPDFRVEYEVDGRERHEDVEVPPPHYRGAHMASRARCGFRCYSAGGSGRSGGRMHVRLAEDLLS